MNIILDTFYNLLNARDTRLNHMPFIQSPWPFLVLISIYVFIIRKGKIWMEHRPPMQIDRIITAFNLMQIIVNSAMFFVITCYIFVFRSNFSFRCEPANFSTDSKGMFIAYLSYSYFILKLTDYCDTVFFILRKKWTHVSFLHVYHHLIVSVGTYLWVLYAPGSQGILLAYLNCFVHAVMYTYYLIAIYKPMGITPSVAMKKNITRLQMIQFCILCIYFLQVFLNPICDCGYPKILILLVITQCILMFVLFAHFYWNAYMNGPKMQHQKIQ